MKLLISFILSIFSTVLLAAPFAETADIPYSSQVTECQFSVNSGPDFVGTLVDTGTVHKCYYDVASLAGTGSANITVKVCNIWGCSAASPLFSFPTAAPTTSSVTGLVPSVP